MNPHTEDYGEFQALMDEVLSMYCLNLPCGYLDSAHEDHPGYQVRAKVQYWALTRRMGR